MPTINEHYAAAVEAMEKGAKLGCIAERRGRRRGASYIDDNNRKTPAPQAEIIKVTKTGRMVLRLENGDELTVRPDGVIDGRMVWSTGILRRPYGMHDSTGWGIWQLWTVAKHKAYNEKLERESAEREAEYVRQQEHHLTIAKPRYERLQQLAERQGLVLSRGNMGGISFTSDRDKHAPVDELISVHYMTERGTTFANTRVSLSVDDLLALTGMLDEGLPS